MKARFSPIPKNLATSAVIVNVEMCEELLCKVYKPLSLHSMSFLIKRTQCLFGNLALNLNRRERKGSVSNRKGLG